MVKKKRFINFWLIAASALSLLFFALLLSSTLSPQRGLAVTGVKVGICPDGSSSADCAGKYYSWGCPEDATNCTSYIEEILKYAERIGLVLVVLSIIWGGYIYLTSQGDSSKLNAAKDRIVGAILGYFLLFLIGAILNYLSLNTG